MSKQSNFLVAACASLCVAVYASSASAECARAAAAPGLTPSSGPSLQIFGTVREVKGNTVTLAQRSGGAVTVDATVAIAAQMSAVLFPDQTVEVVGTLGPNGEVRADLIRRVRGAPASWPQDCMPAK